MIDPMIQRPPTLPLSIKVGPYRYRVILDKHAINQAKVNRENSTVDGETDFTKQTITLDPEMARDAMAEVLLHEVEHVIQNAVGIGSKEKINAHEMIYRTAAMRLLVLRDNPDLVTFLTEATP